MVAAASMGRTHSRAVRLPRARVAPKDQMRVNGCAIDSVGAIVLLLFVSSETLPSLIMTISLIGYAPSM
jgi:hypothetical protein